MRDVLCTRVSSSLSARLPLRVHVQSHNPGWEGEGVTKKSPQSFQRHTLDTHPGLREAVWGWGLRLDTHPELRKAVGEIFGRQPPLLLRVDDGEDHGELLIEVNGVLLGLGFGV
jgi:hypothetical protein